MHACCCAVKWSDLGDHRCSISIHSCKRHWTYDVTFEKDTRNRQEEELLSSQLLLTSLAGAVGTISEEDVQPSMQSLLHDSEKDRFRAEVLDLGDPVLSLLNGSIQCVEFCGSHFVLDAPRRNVLLLPGSFNPIHDGHLKMMQAAEQHTGQRGMFELSVLNPDKGLLAEDIVRQRLEQFTNHPDMPVLLTRASLFRDKALLFHNCTFVVGYDTAIRILQPKYYGDSEANLFIELGTIRHHGCGFLVAGRTVETNGEKRFLQFEDMDIPDALRDMFRGLEDFRLDISSTEIRAQMAMKGS